MTTSIAAPVTATRRRSRMGRGFLTAGVGHASGRPAIRAGAGRDRGRAHPEPTRGEVPEQLDDPPRFLPPEGGGAPPVWVPDPRVVTRPTVVADRDGDDQPRARVVPQRDPVAALDQARRDLRDA